MSADSELAAAVDRLGLGRVGEVLAGYDAWIVGGVARALVAGTPPDADVDIAVDAELEPVLERIGLPVKRHDRFGTAVIDLGDGRHADIARTRVETYPAPGSLPDVEPAPIGDDLARRDFTVNAIAVAVAPPHRILDPHGGAADLAAGTLRILHRGSFADDPTRAVRGARYCARLGLEPEPGTRRMLATADLGTVTRDRRDAELRRLATEREAAAGFRLLAEWGVMPLPPGAAELLDAVASVRCDPLWAGHAEPGARAMADRRGGRPDSRRRDDCARTSGASVRGRRARGRDRSRGAAGPATPAGGAWIERYLHEWSEVRLDDRRRRPDRRRHPRGPAVGAGLGGGAVPGADGDARRRA